MITMPTMPMMPMMMRRGCGRLRILSAIVVAMLMMFSPYLFCCTYILAYGCEVSSIYGVDMATYTQNDPDIVQYRLKGSFYDVPHRRLFDSAICENMTA